MKNQLLYLRKLQAIDIKTKKIQQSILAVPAQLDPAKQDLMKLEGMLVQERKELAETESWRISQEEIVTQEEEALKKAKAKLQEAKNARDFGAASREIDNKKRTIHAREQEVLKVYEALESGRKQLTQHEVDVTKLRTHVEGEEKKFSGLLEELNTQATEASSGREEILSRITPSLLKRYNNVVKRRGNAVTEVINGVCQGCHMSLAPQLANMVTRAEDIQSCRQCNRLLYIADPPPVEESECG